MAFIALQWNELTHSSPLDLPNILKFSEKQVFGILAFAEHSHSQGTLAV